jgi:MYXO-CTERM domain-containing protein
VGAACGSSWCRPVFDAQGKVLAPNTDMVVLGGSYVTLDNVEMTGFATSGGSGGNMVQIVNDHSVVEHSYFHGWSHAASGDTDNATAIGCGGGGGNEGDSVHDNVIDGSDTTKDMMVGVFLICPEVYDNVIRYVTNGIEGAQDIVHDNWLGPILVCYSGCHQNLLQNAGPVTEAYILVYNNVLTGAQTGGMGQLWVEQNSGNTGITAYVFNNVEFNTAVGNNVDMCQEGSACGPLYFFNNTFECGSDGDLNSACASGGGTGPTVTAYWTNNHCIVSGGSCVNASWTGLTVMNETNVIQNDSTANGQGYKSSSPEAFEPTRASGATVGAGTNEQSLCNTIAGLNSAAGAACQKSTGYACSYDETRHSVMCPASSATARPKSAAWDVGAYQCLPSPDGGCAGEVPPAGDGGGSDAGGDGSVGGHDASTHDSGSARPDADMDGWSGSGAGGSGGCGCRMTGDREPPFGAMGVTALAGLVVAGVRRRGRHRVSGRASTSAARAHDGDGDAGSANLARARQRRAASRVSGLGGRRP